MDSITTAVPLPDDYLERVYAGVLGKLIGVYLGRPIEGMARETIIERFGHIRYYLTDQTPHNLVDADDDVSGTFAFIRALEEHGVSAAISAADVGKTWLNNAIENKCPFWWGGRGFSTEHTAYLNLAAGVEAPRSGSIEANGNTVAEQIGGQIFIDGWAMVAPGQPELAAKLADVAAAVSHDGEARYAARSWAAMEAEAFVSSDIDHLLDVGARFIPSDSLLAEVSANVRCWTKSEPDWLKVRQKIEDKYGYDKFSGSCHVIPNHAIMILGLIRGGHDFHEALHIINTCGWDTDCNSGNLGCLVAIMHGLPGINNGGPDWRGPLADRAIISSADGGYSVNNATRIACDIANSGRVLAGRSPLSQPKDAQFHFSLPGGVQGFQLHGHKPDQPEVSVKQEVDPEHGSGLSIRLHAHDDFEDPIEVSTPTFVQPETRKGVQTYPFVGTPLLYPGQKVLALVRAPASNAADLQISLRLQAYSPNPDPSPAPLYTPNPDLDTLSPLSGPPAALSPGTSTTLEWTIPDVLEGQPIARIGLAILPLLAGASPESERIVLHSLGWRGTPKMTFRRPPAAPANPSQAWREAWVDAAGTFDWYHPEAFAISKGKGEGMIFTGTREWVDYRVVLKGLKVRLAGTAGVVFRNRGVRRYYAFCFMGEGRVAFVAAEDEGRREVVGGEFGWERDRGYEVEVRVRGEEMVGFVDGREVLRA